MSDPHLAEPLEDVGEDFLGGPVGVLAVLLAEPAAGQALQVDGVRPLPRQRLVHVLGVPEEGVPVVARGEVHLVLHGTDLVVKARDTQEAGTNYERM